MKSKFYFRNQFLNFFQKVVQLISTHNNFQQQRIRKTFWKNQKLMKMESSRKFVKLRSKKVKNYMRKSGVKKKGFAEYHCLKKLNRFQKVKLLNWFILYTKKNFVFWIQQALFFMKLRFSLSKNGYASLRHTSVTKKGDFAKA